MKSKELLQNIDQEEILDIVDTDDRVIRSMPRSEVYAQNLVSQMRAVWLRLKNQKGELWIPRRCYSRKMLPGHLDGSVVGHVKSGETYEQALIRETQEEVGMSLQGVSYRKLGKLTPKDHQSFCFAEVYECLVDQAPVNWNQEEFCEWFWMSPEEIMERVKRGEKLKDTLPIILQAFYGC